MRDYIFGALLGTAVVSIGYLIYFDHKRKNPNFRRQLSMKSDANLSIEREKQKAREEYQIKDAERSAKLASMAPSTSSQMFGEKYIAELESDPEPKTLPEKEAYFIKHLDAGEKLLSKGPNYYEAAAGCFYRVLNIYPDPMQLLAVLETTIPAPVFNIVMSRMVTEIRKKQVNYRLVYPTKDMNTKIVDIEHGVTPDGKKMIRRGLLLTKDVVAGDVIFSEEPLVASLLADLENSGYCSCCMNRCIPVCRYCSPECQITDDTIFGGQYLSPKNSPSSPLSQSSRNAQEFAEQCLENGTITPILTAKFLSRMIHEETSGQDGLNQDFSLWDHMDRLHYIDLAKPSLVDGSEIWFATPELIKAESEIMFRLFGSVSRFDRFLTEERYTTLRGKFLYNAISIIATPQHLETPSKIKESFKRSDSAFEIGVGLYHISSYLSHSCDPNVEFLFTGSKISLVAKKGMSAGDELLVSFIPEKGKSLKARRKLLKEKPRFMSFNGSTTTHKASSPYEPLNDDEIALKAGDMIIVIHKYDDGWAMAKNTSSNTEGLVPFNFLTPYFESTPISLSPISLAGSRSRASPTEYAKPSEAEVLILKERFNSINKIARERCPGCGNMGHLKIMIVGDSGIGKKLSRHPLLYNEKWIRMSTIHDIPSPLNSEPLPECNLRIFDTAGFGAHVDASRTIDPLMDFIKQQFQQTRKLLQPTNLDTATLINLVSASDAHSHIDVIIYGIFHRVKPIDKEFMRLLSPLAPIVPVILKSDTLDASQVFKLKESILRELDSTGIDLFSFGVNITDCITMAQMEVGGAIPFAITTDDMDSLPVPNRINEMADFLQHLLFTHSRQIRLRCAAKFVSWRESELRLPHNPFEGLGTYRRGAGERKASEVTTASFASFERNAPNYTITERKGSNISLATTTLDREDAKQQVGTPEARSILKTSSPTLSPLGPSHLFHQTPANQMHMLPGVTVPPIQVTSVSLGRQYELGGKRPQIGARYSSIASGRGVDDVGMGREGSAETLVQDASSRKGASGTKVSAFGKFRKALGGK